MHPRPSRAKYLIKIQVSNKKSTKEDSFLQEQRIGPEKSGFGQTDFLFSPSPHPSRAVTVRKIRKKQGQR
jgi:hypothetical protein